MEFEWDEAKSRRNVTIRSLSFETGARIFDAEVKEIIDDRRDYREVRVKAIGVVDGRCIVCIYTDRGSARRIISVRFANRRERDDYSASLKR